MADEQLSKTLPLSSSPLGVTNQTLRILPGSASLAPTSEQRSRSLFRERALAAHHGGEPAKEPLRIAPLWTRATIVAGALLVLGVVTAAFFLRVELVSTGRGMLQAAGPPYALTAQTDGRVAVVSVRAGDAVKKGQELMRLESASVAASLVEATRAVALADAAVADFRARKEPLYDARHRQLVAQANALARRTKSGRATVNRMTRRAQSFDALGREGLSSDLDVDNAKEAISVATREALRSEEEGARILDQIATLQMERLSEETHLSEELAKAKARQDALAFALQACSVVAPNDGVMGTVPVRAGDAVLVGAGLGRVIPVGSPRTAVAYVPERDRAFLRPGGSVRVEIDQLPIWEFGALQGRIVSVGSEIATSADLQSTFGERQASNEPLYRVDVALDTESETFRKLAPRLRAESLASLRFNLRERRLITVLLEPLRHWLE